MVYAIGGKIVVLHRVTWRYIHLAQVRIVQQPLNVARPNGAAMHNGGGTSTSK